MGPLVLLLALGVSPAPILVADQPSLEALAAASSRPRECGGGASRARARKPSVWRKARVPELVPYCDLVAKAHVALETDPKAALDLAEQAEATWPSHAGALVAQGRALLALGKPKEALDKLAKAQEIDKLSVEEPKAMRAHARALLLNGRLEDGADLYRTLVPRASLLPERQRARVLLEAAMASMADAGRKDKKPGAPPTTAALGEAIAFIAEARGTDGAGLAGDVLFAAALVYDRAGDAEKAAVALSEAARVGAKPSDASSYVADPADAAAVSAIALEHTNAAEAQKAWASYLDVSKVESYAASARARSAALKSKAGPAPAKKKKVAVKEVRALAIGIGVAAATLAGSAFATPTRWATARSPEAAHDDETRVAAEEELIAHAREKRSPFEDPILRIESHAPRAVQILEKRGAKASGDWYLGLLLARGYHETSKWAEAAREFERVLADTRVPEFYRTDALADLAIAYARLERQDEEIEAYDTAIALEPMPRNRSLMLANQAEAFMFKGDTSRAIAGYRASLDALANFEAHFMAPTTLWSLGVALDRSGDLEGAFDAIARARSYDPKDVRISGPEWFFVPAYDSNYYDALGEWLVARRGQDTELRLASYERAVVAWKQYLGRAPSTGPYVPVAKARLRVAEKEYAEFSRRAQTPTPIEPAEPRLPRLDVPRRASRKRP